jgi:prepilin-type N-terminal cleavage/methylation domain-containing protein
MNIRKMRSRILADNGGLRFTVYGLRRSPHTAHRTPNKGFTLAEMLIVSLLVAAIALAIFSSFENGMKIWLRANKVVFEEDLNIFLEKFSSQLRNTFEFKGLTLLGSSERFEFPTLVDSQRMKKKTVGKAIYSYDTMSKTVIKEERDYSNIYRNSVGVIAQTLTGVRSLKFFYYYYNEELKDYVWVEEWSDEAGTPLSVKMVLEFEEGDDVATYTRTVDIPTGFKLGG